MVTTTDQALERRSLKLKKGRLIKFPEEDGIAPKDTSNYLLFSFLSFFIAFFLAPFLPVFFILSSILVACPRKSEDYIEWLQEPRSIVLWRRKKDGINNLRAKYCFIFLPTAVGSWALPSYSPFVAGLRGQRARYIDILKVRQASKQADRSKVLERLYSPQLDGTVLRLWRAP